MKNIEDDRYFGFFGWRQFWQNRTNILCKYDAEKTLNKDRPVRTSHGKVLEAEIRKWLSEFLPKKYAVTSGYIIPDVVVTDYTLNHFDIIVYNQLEAPILWIENNEDNSIIGTIRAIPAKYIYCVIEVKATLTKKHISDTIEKLAELNQYGHYFPATFCCSSIFAEIGDEVSDNLSILQTFISSSNLFRYFGSLVLRAKSENTTSGCKR